MPGIPQNKQLIAKVKEIIKVLNIWNFEIMNSLLLKAKQAGKKELFHILY